MPHATNHIAVLGASSRFACVSLRRGGFRCRGIDLFADLETLLAGEAEQAARYPEGLFAALEASPDALWMYTGGLENYPRQAAAAIASGKRLLGASPSALQVLRTPFALRDVLDGCPINFPATQRQAPVKRSGWLAKSLRSCGGLGVLDATEARGRGRNFYYQQRVAGAVLGVTFVAANGRAERLGVTQAFDAEQRAWTGASGYVYGGSVGPLVLPRGQLAALDELGDRLATVEGLAGVFGVDVIRAAPEQLFLIDVNPRLPSSAELLERASGASLAALHVEACLAAQLDPFAERIRELQNKASEAQTCGKAIVYAQREIAGTDRLRERAAKDWREAANHWLTDTPASNTPIRTGQPIATVHAEGSTPTEVVSRLASRADDVRELCDTTE